MVAINVNNVIPLFLLCDDFRSISTGASTMCFQPIFCAFFSGILATLPHLPRHLLCVFCLASSNIQGIYHFLSLAWQQLCKASDGCDILCSSTTRTIHQGTQKIRCFGHSVVPADNKLSSAQKAAEKWIFVDYAVVWKAWKAWIDGS